MLNANKYNAEKIERKKLQRIMELAWSDFLERHASWFSACVSLLFYLSSQRNMNS